MYRGKNFHVALAYVATAAGLICLASCSQGSGGIVRINTSANSAAPVTSPSQPSASSVAPLPPTLQTPLTNPYYSNGSTLTLSGGCASGDQVVVTSPGSPSQSVACVGSSYSVNVSQNADGTYAYSLAQTASGGATSAPTGPLTWVRDTVAPAVPTITRPSVSPYTSADSVLTISGVCETNETMVALSGASSQNTICSSSSYSFSVPQSSDGTYSFSIVQTDWAGNASPAAAFTWVRDTSTPAAPTITAPTGNPFYSNGSGILISGGCAGSDSVNLSGAATQSTTCSGGAFSFTTSQSSDGTYVYSVAQVSASGIASASSSVTWIRDTVAPAAPTVANPISNPYTSADTTFAISGTCETGATVALTGASTQSVSCVSSAYSFSVTQSSDGTYNYSLTETDQAGNTSGATAFQWIRNTAIPLTPTITTPSASPYFSNLSSLSISGACTSGDVLTLSGSDNQTLTCSSSAYQFTSSKSVDGSYLYSVKQTSATGVNSASASITWNRDTVAPAAPSVTHPASNPYTSADTTFALSGACESGATVALTGASTQSVSCVSSAYSFSITQSADGTYNYSLTETDQAGNTSAATAFQWVRNTTFPSTPTITSPGQSPFYSNGSSLVISGGCTSGDLVTLSGAASQTTPCVSAVYTFTITQSTDGSYAYAIKQTSSLNGLDSAQANQTWNRNTVPPPAPSISNPASSPWTSSGNLALSGGCQNAAVVNLGGSVTQSAACSSGAYSFAITETVDATYNFTLTQTDQYGNTSVATSFQWVRDSTLPLTPTVTTPAGSSVISNTSSIVIAGGCTTSDTVTLGGTVVATDVTSPSGSLTQACANSGYSFTIGKTSDGTYSFTVSQGYSGMESAAATVSWTRDTVPPVTTVTSAPASINLAQAATFAFTSNKTGSVFQCSLDSAAFATCASPMTYAAPANGAHTFSVRAVDPAGNIDPSPPKISWDQEHYNTLALYHFDTTPGPFVDSSLYTSPDGNPLTNSGTSAGASAQFGQSRLFTATQSQSMQAPTSGSLALTSAKMSFETFVRLASLPAKGKYMTLASQSGASPQLGWECQLARIGNSYYITFNASLNGTTTTQVTSLPISLNTSKFHHVAVTWDHGSVAFYFDGGAVGTATIGTAGTSTIFNSTAPLWLGADSGGNYLDATLDELRLSQVVRWTSGFTPPAAAYSPD